MKFFTVDAFTNKAFTGNPAGVCLLEKDLPEAEYLSIAREINYSETAFVLKQKNGFYIRWFTPKTEVDLCGHATLAAAAVLYKLKEVSASSPVYFDSRSGELKAAREGDKIVLDFPQFSIEPTASNAILEEAFGIRPVFLGKNNNRYLIEIAHYKDLIALQPNFQLLEEVDLGRFIITAASPFLTYDFVSRYFAPAVGIPEDPVTGTAHCYLAPYWGKKLGKTTIHGLQASDRSGDILCELIGNDRVLLKGNAVIMYEMIPQWHF
ncbi:MAG: PhzF family phenazine biosynthesis protein [Flavobacteriaceae bacterium]|nr:PhzF family phenazine biosynthesis protein [Flavobacteriaceae bacterium]